MPKFPKFSGTVLLICAPAALAQATFTGLGNPAGGVFSPRALSADGSTIVGDAYLDNMYQAYRWTAQSGMLPLATPPQPSRAAAVSADGSVITGTFLGARAFRWTAPSGMLDLGLLPGATLMTAAAISADGLVITGYAGDSGSSRAFRWTLVTGPTDLGDVPGAASRAGLTISADGSVIGGSIVVNDQSHAMRWTPGGGMQDIGVAPGGTHAQLLAVTPSGSIFTGDGDLPGAPFHALAWPGQGPLLDLGGLFASTGVLSTRGQSISSDGHTIVGSAYESGGSPYPYAIIWSSSLGMRDLQTYLSSLGLNLSGWILRSAIGISNDGLTIAGMGEHNGLGETWIAHLPAAPCYANCDGGTIPPALNIQDFTCFLNAFSAGSMRANCDGSTASPVLNIQDFICFVNAFSIGCP